MRSAQTSCKEAERGTEGDDGTKEGALGQWDGECVDGRRSKRTCFVCATANVAHDVSKFIIFDGTTEAGLGDSAWR